MPPRKSVPSLLSLSLGSAGALVIEHAKRVSADSYLVATSLGEEDCDLQMAERRASDMMDANVEAMEKVLRSHTPASLRQKLADAVLRALSAAVQGSKALYRKMNASSPESVHEMHVIVRYVKLVAGEEVSTLDLSKLPKMLRDELCRHLERMKGLRFLNLGPSSGRLSMSLRSLNLLSTVVLPGGDARNDTLAVVGQNCPLLAKLDVGGSAGITDAGATWLLRCKNVTDLNLYLTSVTVQMYAQLLMDLPKLRSVGRCDHFGQVLEYIHLYNSSPVRLPLQFFHSRDMTREQLRMLADVCPELRHVNLYVDEDVGGLLSPLQRLEHLGELKLLGCNFYSDGIDQLLKAKGEGLTLLELEHVDELDMDALYCIATNCPSIRKLVLFSCDFVENFGANGRERSFPPGTFGQLDTLVCVSETAPNVIEFLLGLGDGVRRVQFGSTAWFSDDVVARLVGAGAMANVEEVRIFRSYELTMASVELLLKACPRLRVLAEMEGWEGVSTAELARLRDKVKRCNYDLDTFGSWNLSGSL